jgi:hypothetical protein
MQNKHPDPKEKEALRKKIMQSALASFRIEGTTISKERAEATLKKVELSLGK